MLLHLSMLLLWAGSRPGAWASEPAPKIWGITVSTHTGGSEWGSDQMGPTLDDLRALGANWISFHPYARIGADGSLSWRAFDPAAPPAQLRRPIEEAHTRGMRVLVMPHLAYWGSPFSWRGEIEFSEPAAWRRFFSQYREFVWAIAAAVPDADAFALGNELDRTVAHAGEWRALIAGVRQRTRAALTYAANWTDYQRVPFWGELDWIGVQAYFPLSRAEAPDDAELHAGWAERMAELRAFAATHQRPIVFTELGYNRSRRAAVEPWLAVSDPDPAALDLQVRCMAAALAAVREEATVRGVFLWKWFPGPRSVGRDFQLAYPEMVAVLRRAFGAPAAAAP